MNLLVTTLGMSWQIVPELLGFTNPDQYDFFKGNGQIKLLRGKHNVLPVDECWIITVENQMDLEKLITWAEHWRFTIKIAVCKGIEDFANQQEIDRMRSFMYRLILYASTITRRSNGKLYLSLSGGRKTISADMQEAGNLFGYDIMLHVVDIDREAIQKIRPDALLDDPGKYAEQFIPVIVNEKTGSSFIVSAGDTPITNTDYPFAFTDSNTIFYDEDGTLEQEIQRRKKQSSQLYSNFYASITDSMKGRDIFRKLYFLHPDIIRKLKEVTIGDNPLNHERDMQMLRGFPKADLHSHLGGVLNHEEIIQTALSEHSYIQRILETRGDLREWRNTIQVAVRERHIEKLEAMKESLFALKKSDFPLFYDKLLIFITAFRNSADLLERIVFRAYQDAHCIGIDEYQKLGDFQGSSLLQTSNTITKAAELYVANLIRDKVKYVEIRCSPYKYIKKGLSEEAVVNAVMDVFDRYKEQIEYRLIGIIGREADIYEIQESIKKIETLLSVNKRFAGALAGIDLAGNEGTAPPRALREYFMPFLEKCIRITIHAGETESVDNIWQAVYHLSADRIGHGLTLLDNPDLMRRFIDKNIGVELCPSSNDQIVGYEKPEKPYPLKNYMEAGLKVTVNTDNQGISRTSISQEFYKAATLCCGLSLWDCFVLIRNSLSVAFVNNKTKLALLRSFEDNLYNWCIEKMSGI